MQHHTFLSELPEWAAACSPEAVLEGCLNCQNLCLQLRMTAAMGPSVFSRGQVFRSTWLRFCLHANTSQGSQAASLAPIAASKHAPIAAKSCRSLANDGIITIMFAPLLRHLLLCLSPHLCEIGAEGRIASIHCT